MDKNMIGLKAKVSVANAYLNRLLNENGKVNDDDIRSVVTWNMRPLVEIDIPTEGIVDRLDVGFYHEFVKIKGVA